MKKKPSTPFEERMKEVLRTLTRRDLISIKSSLEKAETQVRAIFCIAQGDGLQEFGDEDVVSILDDALTNIWEAVNRINGIKKPESGMGQWTLLKEEKAGILPVK